MIPFLKSIFSVLPYVLFQTTAVIVPDCRDFGNNLVPLCLIHSSVTVSEYCDYVSLISNFLIFILP